ncbi:ribbon-helix-helix domain-containing protein [Ruminococcus sp.]|uniref:ribbon-helix-helix domain-containing protein n=1 Tax=Ruminococcus sp. TaxID=41978 RepID=UPI002E818CC0|nr:ribbon-helix-helix domain-containing protein [Ruminococcus sp.]MEE3492374.1 ribbon-helix-helix domain-containing protein [Ruminococcus sp.]
MEESKKVPIIFTRDQIESMDNFIKENEGYSRSSFVREAVEYYLGYIDMNENVNYISPLINQNIKLILSRFEAKMSEMIFKMAVEVCKSNILTAYQSELSDRALDYLDRTSKRIVAEHNGTLDLEDTQKYLDEHDVFGDVNG